MVGQGGRSGARRSAFQEAIAHLGKAIAMADKAGGQRKRRGAAPDQRLTQLQTAYGNALLRRAAMARRKRQRRSLEPANWRRRRRCAERFASDYGLWVSSYVRGELPDAGARRRS